MDQAFDHIDGQTCWKVFKHCLKIVLCSYICSNIFRIGANETSKSVVNSKYHMNLRVWGEGFVLFDWLVFVSQLFSSYTEIRD